MATLTEEIDPPRFYRFGEFEIDLVEETLHRDGERLNINHRMFQVLHLLIERKGEVVSKDEFFEKVWGGSFVEDNNLTVTITALRKVLGDNAKQARFFENIPRKGYRFVAPVSNGNAREETGIALPPGSASELYPKTERSSRLVIATVGAFLIVAFAMMAASFNGVWAPKASTKDQIDSIAILPFESRDPDSEYLADGLTDNIISNLSKLSGLLVIDRNSAFKYKNKASDPMTAGRELNVQAVVTGRIEQNDDVVIINAELTDLATNSAIWRRQFRRQISEIFITQQEISDAIAQSLGNIAADRQQGEMSKHPTEDPTAYDLFLRGRYLWNKRTNVDIERSAKFFQAAIDNDPTFAKAYIGLADAYTLGDFSNLKKEEKNAMIRGAVQRALEIDPNLGEAYASLAINKSYYDWDFAGAESDYRKAVELSPNDATAHHWYAEFLSMQGRFQESFAEYDRAISLDPLSLPIKADMAFSHFYARDYTTAIELLNRLKSANPEYDRTFEFLIQSYREIGKFAESADSLERLIDLKTRSGDWPSEGYQLRMKTVANLRKGFQKPGEAGYWRADLENGNSIKSDALYTATAYAKLGESDKAFEFLEKAFKQRLSGMVWLKVMPELDGIRSDPRYKELLRKVGFSE